MIELKGNKFDIYIANKIRNKFFFDARYFLSCLSDKCKEVQAYTKIISPSFSDAFCLTSNIELLNMLNAFMDISLISDAKWWKKQRGKTAHDILREYIESEKSEVHTVKYPTIQRIYTLNEINDPSLFYDSKYFGINKTE